MGRSKIDKLPNSKRVLKLEKHTLQKENKKVNVFDIGLETLLSSFNTRVKIILPESYTIEVETQDDVHIFNSEDLKNFVVRDITNET